MPSGVLRRGAEPSGRQSLVPKGRSSTPSPRTAVGLMNVGGATVEWPREGSPQGTSGDAAKLSVA